MWKCLPRVVKYNKTSTEELFVDNSATDRNYHTVVTNMICRNVCADRYKNCHTVAIGTNFQTMAKCRKCWTVHRRRYCQNCQSAAIDKKCRIVAT